jgi:hypothetical protein
MKIQILEKVRKTIEEQIIKEIELDYPKESKFYKMSDNGRFFARGTVLFGIVIKYSTSFLLFEIERGKQFCTDFIPTKDCHQDYWLNDTNDIRRTALKIMQGKHEALEEITRDEFLELRKSLLDAPFESLL